MAVGTMPGPAAGSLAVFVSQPVSKVITLPGASARIPALDGLRGIAILLVLLWHGLFQLQFGSPTLVKLLKIGALSWSGVDLFFVLSGFLIGGILLDAKYSSRYFQTFYVRRAYRILPLYLLLVGIHACLRCPFLPRWLSPFSADQVPLLSYISFTQNIWMALTGGFGSIVMAATWSLAIEEQFYLTAPFLVRKLRKSALVLVLGAFVIVAPLLRAFLYHRLRHGGFASYVLMPCRADTLALGMLAAILIRDGTLWSQLIARRYVLYGMTGALVLPLVYLAWLRSGQYSGPMVTAGYTLLALFYFCCLLITLTSSGVLRKILCNRRLMDLGSVAYCTYLLHLPVMELCERLFKRRVFLAETNAHFTAGILGIMLTLILAKISWKYFESPLLRLGHAHKY